MPEDFGSREHHIVRILQIGAAMVLLCAMSLATSVAAALRESAKTEAELHGLAEAVEVMKEILAQVSVNPGYKDAKDRRQCCVARRASQLSDLPGRGSKQHAVPHPSFEGIRRRAMGMVCGFLRDVGISLGCLTQRLRGSKRRKSVLP